ncbi:hypothetical protein AX760_19365 [Pararhizobium antarcticum]|uniref:Uncharacterized protein n=2 Tax=Pararhizobium antarcticum TaxID=1798805 RepID=A0A657LQY4_9HYPH|nr:hypothetical protein AX760_19365 [Pararhizobium antarcticum]OJF99714.1 hypothetical protein AX761_25010 [Rhizobium sp. 58]
MVAGFKSERWPVNDRNGGRLQSGIRTLNGFFWEEAVQAQPILHRSIRDGASQSPFKEIESHRMPKMNPVYGDAP